MNQRVLAELIDVDLPAEELERLVRVDALLRLVAAADRMYAFNPLTAQQLRVGPRTADGFHERRSHRAERDQPAG
jgi:hypothetical protein